MENETTLCTPSSEVSSIGNKRPVSEVIDSSKSLETSGNNDSEQHPIPDKKQRLEDTKNQSLDVHVSQSTVTANLAVAANADGTTDPAVAANTVGTTDPAVAGNSVATTDPAVAGNSVGTTDPAVAGNSVGTTDPAVAGNTVGTTDPAVAGNTVGTTDPAVAANNGRTSDPAVAANNEGTSDPAVAGNTAGTTDPAVAGNNGRTSHPAVAGNTVGTTDPAVAGNTVGTTDPAVAANNGRTSDPAVAANNGGTSDPAVAANTAGKTDPAIAANTDGTVQRSSLATAKDGKDKTEEPAPKQSTTSQEIPKLAGEQLTSTKPNVTIDAAAPSSLGSMLLGKKVETKSKVVLSRRYSVLRKSEITKLEKKLLKCITVKGALLRTAVENFVHLMGYADTSEDRALFLSVLQRTSGPSILQEFCQSMGDGSTKYGGVHYLRIWVKDCLKTCNTSSISRELLLILMHQLSRLPVNTAMLQATKLGKQVTKVKQYQFEKLNKASDEASASITKLSSKILQDWKASVAEEAKNEKMAKQAEEKREGAMAKAIEAAKKQTIAIQEARKKLAEEAKQSMIQSSGATIGTTHTAKSSRASESELKQLEAAKSGRIREIVEHHKKKGVTVLDSIDDAHPDLVLRGSKRVLPEDATSKTVESSANVLEQSTVTTTTPPPNKTIESKVHETIAGSAPPINVPGTPIPVVSNSTVTPTASKSDVEALLATATKPPIDTVPSSSNVSHTGQTVKPSETVVDKKAKKAVSWGDKELLKNIRSGKHKTYGGWGLKKVVMIENCLASRNQQVVDEDMRNLTPSQREALYEKKMKLSSASQGNKPTESSLVKLLSNQGKWRRPRPVQLGEICEKQFQARLKYSQVGEEPMQQAKRVRGVMETIFVLKSQIPTSPEPLRQKSFVDESKVIVFPTEVPKPQVPETTSSNASAQPNTMLLVQQILKSDAMKRFAESKNPTGTPLQGGNSHAPPQQPYSQPQPSTGPPVHQWNAPSQQSSWKDQVQQYARTRAPGFQTTSSNTSSFAGQSASYQYQYGNQPPQPHVQYAQQYATGPQHQQTYQPRGIVHGQQGHQTQQAGRNFSQAGFAPAQGYQQQSYGQYPQQPQQQQRYPQQALQPRGTSQPMQQPHQGQGRWDDRRYQR